MEASLRDEVQRTIEQARLYNVQLQQAHAQYTLLQAWKQFASVALAEGDSLLPYVAWSRSWRRFQDANVATNSVSFLGWRVCVRAQQTLAARSGPDRAHAGAAGAHWRCASGVPGDGQLADRGPALADDAPSSAAVAAGTHGPMHVFGSRVEGTGFSRTGTAYADGGRGWGAGIYECRS